MKQITALWLVLPLVGALGHVFSAQAVDVNFTGTLVAPPPCVINSNSNISVDFGNNMLAGRIDGINYEKAIVYTLDCTGATSATLKLKFQGISAGFDASVLSTSEADLGLELRSDGVKLPMNTWLNFLNPDRPVLTVVPVKNDNLSGGPFTAASTLVVAYQ